MGHACLAGTLCAPGGNPVHALLDLLELAAHSGCVPSGCSCCRAEHHCACQQGGRWCLRARQATCGWPCRAPAAGSGAAHATACAHRERAAAAPVGVHARQQQNQVAQAQLSLFHAPDLPLPRLHVGRCILSAAMAALCLQALAEAVHCSGIAKCMSCRQSGLCDLGKWAGPAGSRRRSAWWMSCRGGGRPWRSCCGSSRSMCYAWVPWQLRCR